MVRTQSPHHAVGLDLSRVLAMSTAIALHVLALALLLIPLSYRPLPPQEKSPPRWTLPERVPAPPPPPEQVVRLPTPPQVPALVRAPERSQPSPAPLAEAVPVAEAAYALPDPAPALPAQAPASTPSTAPISVGQLQYLQAPPPAYPRTALRDRLQGTVILRVRVGTDGVPVEVTVETSSGHRVLDQAARSQVLRTWRFRPALQGDRAVQAYGRVPVSFTLD